MLRRTNTINLILCVTEIILCGAMTQLYRVLILCVAKRRIPLRYVQAFIVPLGGASEAQHSRLFSSVVAVCDNYINLFSCKKKEKLNCLFFSYMICQAFCFFSQTLDKVYYEDRKKSTKILPITNREIIYSFGVFWPMENNIKK